jgi:carbon storage regulator CsrA
MGRLTISREEGQSFWIGDDVLVTVSRIESGQIKVTIDAPTHIIVDRDEVRQRRNNNWIKEVK